MHSDGGETSREKMKCRGKRALCLWWVFACNALVLFFLLVSVTRKLTRGEESINVNETELCALMALMFISNSVFLSLSFSL